MYEKSREYHKAIDYLCGEIKNGNLKVGSKLPTERKIAEVLKISRNSTREALRSLDNMGVIESRRGSGNYLTGNISKNLSEMIRMMLLINAVNQKEICDFRRSMEKAVCFLVIEKNTGMNWQEAERLFSENVKTEAEEIENDRKFHYMLIKASENRFWIELMNAITDVYREWIDAVISTSNQQTKDELRQVHLDIIDAIKNNDIMTCEKAIDRHYDIIDKKIEEREKQ